MSNSLTYLTTHKQIMIRKKDHVILTNMCKKNQTYGDIITQLLQEKEKIK